MSSINSVLMSGATMAIPPADSGTKDPVKIREAASQFESLLIGQVFKTVHEDEEGWLGAGEDQSASPAMGMADEYLAQSISKHGGLGLAKMIERQLSSAAVSSAAGATPDEPPAGE